MNNNSSQDPTIEDLKSKIGFGIKFWLEFESDDEKIPKQGKSKTHDKNILGSGWAKLLKNIHETKKNERKSLTQAANECGYSYKYAWNILKRIEDKTGMSAVTTSKGGRGGGGWIELNQWGIYLLDTYNKLSTELDRVRHNLQSSLSREK